MPEIIFRTLRHEYRLLCPDREAVRALTFIEIKPSLPGTSLRDVQIDVERHGEVFLVDHSSTGRVEGSALHLLNALHALIYADLLAGEPGCPILHCATLINPINPTGRIAVLGAKGTGKTTLMLALMAQGFKIEGDEHLVLREHEVIARPRTLRVKSGSLKLVPQLAAAVSESPFIETWDRNRIYAFSPAQLGSSWTITPGTLDHIFILEASHGGPSTIEPLGPESVLEDVLKQTIFPNHGKSAVFARLRASVFAARCCRMSFGALESVGELVMRQIAALS